jgi:acetolactate synthase-1/2/3 large subunit
MMIISGQVKREMIADYSRLRQLGEQEINIVDMVKPVTKYAVTVMDAGEIGYELEKAYTIAISSRPGPVWINLPLDVQGSFIDENKLRRYSKDCRIPVVDTGLSLQVKNAVEMLKSAKRPVFLFGAGIRIGSACGLLDKVVKACNIPVLLSFNGMDLIADDHPLFIGKPGIIGQRRANFALQNSDCLLSVGSRLNVKIVGYNYKAFAPKAKKIIVDIDPEELAKPTVSADLAIAADAGEFLTEFLAQIQNSGVSSNADWINACNEWKRQYPNIIDSFYADKEHVNTYVFYDKLSDILDPADIVVSGNGMAAVCLYQAFKVKPCQRVFTNNGYGAMGWDLPAAIGASIASGKKRVICVSGDGSFHMNIQELEFL